MANEPVPQGYRSPSVLRDTAQSLTVGRPPTIQPVIIDVQATEVKPTANGPSLWDRFVNSWKESVPQLEAMFREAVKDIRQTGMQVFFNHHEHSPEVGAPMTYTQQMVNQEIKDAHTVHGLLVEQPSVNCPTTAVFEAEMAASSVHSYPDHERER